MAYVWENVYTYDREFRLHMSRYPQCSWGMILQQAWSLRLKDRLSAGNNWDSTNNFSNNNSRGNSSRAKVNEPCRHFNRGHCNFGATCKYEHKCSYCFKYGHGSVHCRKVTGDRNGQQQFKQKRDSDKKGFSDAPLHWDK